MDDFSLNKFSEWLFSPFLSYSEHPMIFTEYPFWIFFLFVLIGYGLIHSKMRLRIIFLFLASLFFYFKTSGFFFSILLTLYVSFLFLNDESKTLLIFSNLDIIFLDLFNNLQKNKTNYKNFYWYKKIIEISERNNSILIDLMDFIDFKKKPFYFHSCDGHWSEYGNNFAAKVFLDHYKQN